MAIEIVVPRLGWSMEEGTFGQWLKQDGQHVRAGEMLFVLEGEKAAQDIESFDSGILRILPTAPRAGETVRVGQLLGYLVTEGEPAPFDSDPVPPPIAAPSTASAPSPIATPQAGPAARRRAREFGSSPVASIGAAAAAVTSGAATSAAVTSAAVVSAEVISGVMATDDLSRPAAVAGAVAGPAARRTSSPRARRLASELGVDWSAVRGTGRSGRVRERDVRGAASGLAERRADGQPFQIKPHSKVRRTIADRMQAAFREAAPVTLSTQADATNLVNLRAQFKVAAASTGDLVPTYGDVIIKLAGVALQPHPLLMAQWRPEGLFFPPDINIAFAVDTEHGLFAPVLRGVPGLSLRQITAQSRRLEQLARDQQLSNDDLQGATFTVSNLGNFGVDVFTPIISVPQCAVLGIGRIRREPAVVGDEILPRHRVALSLSFDHRIVDGAPAARFLDSLRQTLENPSPWLVA